MGQEWKLRDSQAGQRSQQVRMVAWFYAGSGGYGVKRFAVGLDVGRRDGESVF